MSRHAQLWFVNWLALRPQPHEHHDQPVAACGVYGPHLEPPVKHHPESDRALVSCARCVVLIDQAQEEGDRLLQRGNDRLAAVKSRLGGHLE